MAYEIPIDSTALDEVISKLEKAAEATKHLREETTASNRELKASRTTVRGPGSGGGGSGGGGSDPWTRWEQSQNQLPQQTPEQERAARYHEMVLQRQMQRAEQVISPTTPELKYAAGPHQRAFMAEQFLANAKESGDERKIKDAELYAARARLARDRADAPPKTQQQLMMEAFTSSRIGPGGQLMPLITKLQAAGTTREQLQNHFIGMGADPDMAAKVAPMAAKIAQNALPIAIAATGVAAAVAGIAIVTNRALEMGRAGAEAYWRGGGNPGATGKGMALAGFVGKDLGSASQAFGDKLREGSFGSGYMRSKGIYDLGSYTTDKTTNYIRGIDELRRIKSDSQAIRVARDLGMEAELRYRDLSNPTYERLKRSMGDRGSAQSRRDSAEFDANRTIISNTWDQMVARIGNPYVRAASWAMTPGKGPLTDFIHGGVNGFIEASADPMGFMRNRLNDLSGGRMFPGGDSGSENTKAIKDMTRQLKDSTEMIGSGSRGNPIPGGYSSAWKLNSTDESLKAQAMMMGAFSV